MKSKKIKVFVLATAILLTGYQSKVQAYDKNYKEITGTVVSFEAAQGYGIIDKESEKNINWINDGKGETQSYSGYSMHGKFTTNWKLKWDVPQSISRLKLVSSDKNEGRYALMEYKFQYLNSQNSWVDIPNTYVKNDKSHFLNSKGNLGDITKEEREFTFDSIKTKEIRLQILQQYSINNEYNKGKRYERHVVNEITAYRGRITPEVPVDVKFNLITGETKNTTTAMEYSIDGGQNWTSFKTNNEILDKSVIALIDSNNDLKVRVKETDDNFVSGIHTVDIKPAPEAPSHVKFSVATGVTKDTTTAMEYSIDGGQNWITFGDDNENLNSILAKLDANKDFQVRVKGTDDTLTGKVYTMDIKPAPEAPIGVTVKLATAQTTNTSEAMEYSIDGGQNWMSFKGINEKLLLDLQLINNLSVRIKATDDTLTGLVKKLERTQVEAKADSLSYDWYRYYKTNVSLYGRTERENPIAYTNDKSVIENMNDSNLGTIFYSQRDSDVEDYFILKFNENKNISKLVFDAFDKDGNFALKECQLEYFDGTTWKSVRGSYVINISEKSAYEFKSKEVLLDKEIVSDSIRLVYKKSYTKKSIYSHVLRDIAVYEVFFK